MGKKVILIALLWLCLPVSGKAMERYWNYCQKGGYNVTTQGLQSSNLFQQTFASCTVHVYLAGTTTLATLYSDNLSPTPTPLANPFTSAADGYFEFYATGGRYDVQMTSSTGTPQYTWGDISLCDPFGPNADSACTPGGTGAAHNLLSTTHLDTIPASPPIRGDIITAQNQTSPTGVNPSWARLALGTAKQCVTSDGTDAKWDGCWWNIYNNGSLVATEQGLNFIPGTNISFSPFADNPGTKSVDLTLNSVVQVQNSGTAVGAEPILNFTAGTGITFSPFTDAGGKINLTINSTGGGGGSDCSTTVAGIWDIVPQTCAGEKTLQGIAGNPTVTNLNIVPASDQTAWNFYSGVDPTNFTYSGFPTDGGTALYQSFNDIASLNQAGWSGTETPNYTNALTITNQDDTGTVGQFRRGLDSWVSVTGGTLLSAHGARGNCELQAGTIADSCDGLVGRAVQYGGTADEVDSIDAGTVQALGTTTYGVGLTLENQATCGAANCFAWFYPDRGPITSSSFMTPDGSIQIGSTGAAATQGIRGLRIYPDVFSTLPACSSSNEGDFAPIIDSTTTTWGATITGGGSGHVVAYCNGTNWVVSGGGSTVLTPSGAITAGHCVQWASSITISDAGGACGTSGGITSLNGLTASSQTFATGTSGADFNISSSGTAHTFNLPTASASNRGLLSTTDWSTFNGKAGITGSPTAGHCVEWFSATVIEDAGSACGSGSMVYPGAGVAVSTGSAWGTSLTAPSGALVGTTDTQTLTNKTIDGVTPTMMGYVDPTSSIQTQLNGKATTVASGTAALGTSSIASGACAAVVTVSATGVATTDVISVGYNGDPTAVAGYGVSSSGAVLTIYPYPSANNVNFKVCNSTGSPITPGSLTINWRVTR